MSNKSHSKECESERDGRTRWKFSLPSCAHDQLFVDILMCRVVEKKPCCQLFHLQQLILLIFSLNFWLFFDSFSIKICNFVKINKKKLASRHFSWLKSRFCIFVFSRSFTNEHESRFLSSERLKLTKIVSLICCCFAEVQNASNSHTFACIIADYSRFSISHS